MGPDFKEQTGFNFAEGLYALVREHGPPEMTTAQKDAMAAALLETAVEWSKAHNRARARAHEETGHG